MIIVLPEHKRVLSVRRVATVTRIPFCFEAEVEEILYDRSSVVRGWNKRVSNGALSELRTKQPGCTFHPFF